MQATELFFAPGTPERVRQEAQSLPAYDLLKAYRDAQAACNSNDIVLVVGAEFVAMPRAAYLEKAFRWWDEKQRMVHPLAREAAHKNLKVPVETPAWWLVIEYPDSGAMVCCAVGAFRHVLEVEAN